MERFLRSCCLAFLIDQATKFMARGFFSPYPQRSFFLEGWLSVTNLQVPATGSNWASTILGKIFGGWEIYFDIFMILLIAVLIIVAIKKSPKAGSIWAGVGIGGGLSNWLEPQLRGFKTDWINFFGVATANIADFCVFLSITAILVIVKRRKK